MLRHEIEKEIKKTIKNGDQIQNKNQLKWNGRDEIENKIQLVKGKKSKEWPNLI
jgi:hypothetical protein